MSETDKAFASPAYPANSPLLDETPADVEWLLSMGIEHFRRGRNRLRYWMAGSVIRIACTSIQSVPEIGIEKEIDVLYHPTRGSVRALLLALGVQR